jgi:hypothetical protein
MSDLRKKRIGCELDLTGAGVPEGDWQVWSPVAHTSFCKFSPLGIEEEIVTFCRHPTGSCEMFCVCSHLHQTIRCLGLAFSVYLRQKSISVYAKHTRLFWFLPLAKFPFLIKGWERTKFHLLCWFVLSNLFSKH